MKSVLKTGIFLLFFCLSLQMSTGMMTAQNQDLLSQLGQHQNYTSKRISSYDRTGGNNDRLSIEPGKTAVLAEIKGPAAIHHIWITISAFCRSSDR